MAKFSNDVLIEGENIRTYTAGAAIEGGAVVKITGDDTVQHADTAGEAAIGIAAYDAASGDDVAVLRDGTKGRAVDGAGNISAGDELAVDVSNNNGELGTATNDDRVIAVAATSGGSVGDIVEVEVDLQGIVQTA